MSAFMVVLGTELGSDARVLAANASQMPFLSQNKGKVLDGGGPVSDWENEIWGFRSQDTGTAEGASIAQGVRMEDGLGAWHSRAC